MADLPHLSHPYQGKRKSHNGPLSSNPVLAYENSRTCLSPPPQLDSDLLAPRDIGNVALPATTQTDDNVEEICPICLDPIFLRSSKISVLPCLHSFCRSCIELWTLSYGKGAHPLGLPQGTCPLCKTDFKEGVVQILGPQKGSETGSVRVGIVDVHLMTSCAQSNIIRN
jgi:hypothetical protein